MALRDKLKKLEQEVEPHYETLHLPDGTQVRYTDEEALEASKERIEERKGDKHGS